MREKEEQNRKTSEKIIVAREREKKEVERQNSKIDEGARE